MFWVLSGLGPGPTPGGAPENFWICILEVSFKQPACSQPTSQHLDLFLECEGWHFFQANICRIVRVDFFIDTFIPGIWGLAFFQVNICKIVRVYFSTDAFIPGIWGLVVFSGEHLQDGARWLLYKRICFWNVMVDIFVRQTFAGLYGFTSLQMHSFLAYEGWHFFQANICRMVHVDFFTNAFVSGMWWLTFLSDKRLQDRACWLVYECIFLPGVWGSDFLRGESLRRFGTTFVAPSQPTSHLLEFESLVSALRNKLSVNSVSFQ